MIVTFCGHSHMSNCKEVDVLLRKYINDLIEEGATEFYCGGYGEFDSMAAHAVRDAKAAHPEIKSYLIIPYLNREYNTELYDGSIYPPIEDALPRFAISKRNQWMVEQADVVISGVSHDWGGAATTLKHAKRKKKRIISVVE
ncbi:MAG: DUF1273 domain-containing protein [Ruminococcaceae bacterium]|nr:DUF1273 domain-containing protein [Oscillospiraceae bacterium]